MDPNPSDSAPDADDPAEHVQGEKSQSARVMIYFLHEADVHGLADGQPSKRQRRESEEEEVYSIDHLENAQAEADDNEDAAMSDESGENASRKKRVSKNKEQEVGAGVPCHPPPGTHEWGAEGRQNFQPRAADLPQTPSEHPGCWVSWSDLSCELFTSGHNR